MAWPCLAGAVAVRNELGNFWSYDKFVCAIPPPSASFRALGTWLTSHKGQPRKGHR